jgi:hypothetical protein
VIYWNAQRQQCDCVPPFTDTDCTGIGCGVGSIGYTVVSEFPVIFQCICGAGFVLANTTTTQLWKACVANCSSPGTYSAEETSCICNPGYVGAQCNTYYGYQYTNNNTVIEVLPPSPAPAPTSAPTLTTLEIGLIAGLGGLVVLIIISIIVYCFWKPRPRSEVGSKTGSKPRRRRRRPLIPDDV